MNWVQSKINSPVGNLPNAIVFKQIIGEDILKEPLIECMKDLTTLDNVKLFLNKINLFQLSKNLRERIHVDLFEFSLKYISFEGEDITLELERSPWLAILKGDKYGWNLKLILDYRDSCNRGAEVS